MIVVDTSIPKADDVFWMNYGDNTVHVIEVNNRLIGEIHDGDSQSPITGFMTLNAEKTYAEQAIHIWAPETLTADEELYP